MGRLLRIDEVEELMDVRLVPQSAVNDAILAATRELYEEEHVEKFIRELLYDPNRTPHGPTEIADILTTRVHVAGRPTVAAFVLKGRSFKRVSSRDVAHQFIRLQQVPDLGLMVFWAVGHIQDDAQRDFITIALNIGCDYLIIDAQDCARLFLAYQKTCPEDGTPYELGRCGHGHLLDDGLPLQMQVREEVQYTIVRQEDLSHGSAKRYSGEVLIDRHYPKPLIRMIIRDVTNQLRDSKYYRDSRTEARWGSAPAHVVWLYVGADPDDIRERNWVCRTEWIDPHLADSARPISMKEDEVFEGIKIHWNPVYKEHKVFLTDSRASKGEYLAVSYPIVRGMMQLAQEVVAEFAHLQRGGITQEQFEAFVQARASKAENLLNSSLAMPFPPEDCKDFDRVSHGLIATVHDFFIYHSAKGLETWSADTRRTLVVQTIRRYESELRRLAFEEEKIH